MRRGAPRQRSRQRQRTSTSMPRPRPRHRDPGGRRPPARLPDRRAGPRPPVPGPRQGHAITGSALFHWIAFAETRRRLSEGGAEPTHRVARARRRALDNAHRALQTSGGADVTIHTICRKSGQVRPQLSEDARGRRLDPSVPLQGYVDASSDTGLDALGLPASYPRTTPGSVDVVSHAVCQPIGARLFDEGELGIACRSAATIDGSGAELAWFHQHDRVVPDVASTQTFEQWW
jgi:hypothetical protein